MAGAAMGRRGLRGTAGGLGFGLEDFTNSSHPLALASPHIPPLTEQARLGVVPFFNPMNARSTAAGPASQAEGDVAFTQIPCSPGTPYMSSSSSFPSIPAQ